MVLIPFPLRLIQVKVQCKQKQLLLELPREDVILLGKDVTS